jgi:Tfp pilus assembly protein PilZ
MREPETKMEMYSIIPRLFRLINDLSEDQQLMLLRQIMRGNIKQQLFKSIVAMTEAQQSSLLQQLKKTPINETPDRTLSINDEESSMRGHRRKRCLINVNYSIQGREYKDYILDISSVGVFIETKENFTIGQEMALTFKLPSYQQPLKLEASVAWIGHRGIGIKFKHLSPYQEEIIQSFIDKKDDG